MLIIALNFSYHFVAHKAPKFTILLRNLVPYLK
jgi:hypothetical protein